MREIVSANGVDLCVESIGDADDPPILLIMGSSASMDWWEDEFCERLALGGLRVIRYDLRDTGESVTYAPGSPPYGVGDLVQDALGLLDALGVGHAHIAGMSMGGALAQMLTRRHPDRADSLTLISTGPVGPSDPDLPGMSEETIARFSEAARPDWSDRDSVIEYGTHLARVSAAGSRPFDAAGMRELWGRVFDRSANLESSFANHNAIIDSDAWDEPRGEIGVPTLVIHGDEDPVVPLGQGEALAKLIPGAEMVVLEGVGHELPRRVWDPVVVAIVELTATS